MQPVILPANQPPDRFYAGGDRIAAFRGVPPTPGNRPEDWVASTTPLFGETSLGLTRLPDGAVLAEAVRSDPPAWLGPDHVAAHGADTGLLVKLLDAGQRLPVHMHPDKAFARRHLGLDHGKTEAWVFLGPTTVHLAFVRDVAAGELAGWVAEQDVEAMLGATHTLSVERGDAVLVPAGVPHAIGAGALLVEVQEPTDLSILAEWRDFDLDGARFGHLGLGFDVSLQAVDRRGWSVDEVQALRTARAGDVGPLFPGAGEFFRADRVREQGSFEPGFAVVVVTDGNGVLGTSGAGQPVTRGQTVLVPYAAGRVELSGGEGFEAVVCRPPLASPSAPAQ